jgi:hypothetical protein
VLIDRRTSHDLLQIWYRRDSENSKADRGIGRVEVDSLACERQESPSGAIRHRNHGKEYARGGML